MNRRPRSAVVALSRDSEREALLDVLSADPYDFDVVFVDSIARGYERIRKLRPDIVVIFMAIDDIAACRLLSMLTLDRIVSGIPVLTCITRRSGAIVEPLHAEFGTMASKGLWM